MGVKIGNPAAQSTLVRQDPRHCRPDDPSWCSPPRRRGVRRSGRANPLQLPPFTSEPLGSRAVVPPAPLLILLNGVGLPCVDLSRRRLGHFRHWPVLKRLVMQQGFTGRDAPCRPPDPQPRHGILHACPEGGDAGGSSLGGVAPSSPVLPRRAHKAGSVPARD